MPLLRSSLASGPSLTAAPEAAAGAGALRLSPAADCAAWPAGPAVSPAIVPRTPAPALPARTPAPLPLPLPARAPTPLLARTVAAPRDWPALPAACAVALLPPPAVARRLYSGFVNTRMRLPSWATVDPCGAVDGTGAAPPSAAGTMGHALAPACGGSSCSSLASSGGELSSSAAAAAPARCCSSHHLPELWLCVQARKLAIVGHRRALRWRQGKAVLLA